jgi:hypothetical protein
LINPLPEFELVIEVAEDGDDCGDVDGVVAP